MPRLYKLHSADNRYVALPEKFVFVFGSNLAGRHGKGAAKDAIDYFGASRKIPIGLSGSSYAIPTKDARLNVLPIDKIEIYTQQFIEFAKTHPDLTFLVTTVGCGLAGYFHEEMAPLFADSPSNCVLPDVWREFLPEDAHFVIARPKPQWLAH